MIRRLLIPTLCLAFAACGFGTPAPEFDLTLTKTNFAAECSDPTVVDEMFCNEVDVDGMTAAGTTLIVPTNLNPTAPSAATRAGAICEDVIRYDGATGQAIGEIEVLDMDGDVAATCSAR